MLKNVIFDIGGVLLEYRWLDMLTCDYGMDKSIALKFGENMFGDPLWSSMDLGNISVDEAVEQYGIKYPDYQKDIKWFLNNAEKMRINRTRIWDMFPKIKEAGYNIYILSNYSNELLEIHTKGASFWNYVDGEVISYQIHKIKPSVEIYRFLLEKYSLIPSECIFFDDRPENVQGAINESINAALVTSEEFLAEEIGKLIDLKR